MKSVLFTLGLLAVTSQAATKRTGLKSLFQDKFQEDPFANEPLFYDDFAEVAQDNTTTATPLPTPAPGSVDNPLCLCDFSSPNMGDNGSGSTVPAVGGGATYTTI